MKITQEERERRNEERGILAVLRNVSLWFDFGSHIHSFTVSHTQTQTASPFPIMEDEAIGLVLARATELRSNLTNSIHSTHSNLENDDDDDDDEQEQEEEEEKAERLLNICGALDSLETQLSSFQVALITIIFPPSSLGFLFSCDFLML